MGGHTDRATTFRVAVKVMARHKLQLGRKQSARSLRTFSCAVKEIIFTLVVVKLVRTMIGFSLMNNMLQIK